MNITYFPNAKDTKASPHTGDWQDIVAFMREAFDIERHRNDKLNAPAIIAGRCEGRRANANVRHLSFLAADFDIGPDDPRYLPFDAMCDRLDGQGLAYAAYTTTANDRPHNRYRLIMPLGRDVMPGDWLAVWEACNARFDGAVDKATKDPARLSFLPATWLGNPYFDKGKNKQVTLTDPFNAIRMRIEGEPVLSAAEIDAATLNSVFRFGDTAEASCPANHKTSPAPAGREIHYTYLPSKLTADERDALSRGARQDAPCWSFIGKLETSPLVTRWMRDVLPHEAGSRDYRFLRYAARNAVKHSIPITVPTLCDLASEWSRSCLLREPPGSLAREAENALAWAFRAPMEQPLETAPKPSKET